MNKKRLLTLVSIGSLSLMLTACASPAIQEGWLHQHFRQWHPQAGDARLGTTGTQCFFCAPANEPEIRSVAPEAVQVADIGGDSDDDGVPDSMDECRNTLAGTPVDARGCTLDRDNDNDGVLDGNDQCPQTPRGAKVDGRGCWELRPLHFQSQGAHIERESRSILKEAVIILKENPQIKINIIGHADNSGKARLNKKLAEKRAVAVQRYLVKAGISKDRLTITNAGDSQPLADNKTKEGRAQNRRVELEPALR